VSVLALGFGLVIVVFVVGVIAAAWIVRIILFRKARAMGWRPPARPPAVRGSYGPDGQFHPDAPDHPRPWAGGHHGGFGGFGGGHGGGHHGGGGGDSGGGHHH
jgi:hypothetical protein